MDLENKDSLNLENTHEGGQEGEVKKENKLNLKDIKIPLIPPSPLIKKENVPQEAPGKKEVPVQKKKKQDNSSPKIKNIRTYQGDVARSIKKDDVSVIKMALAEQKREPTEPKEESKKKLLLISISTALIIGGILTPTIFFFLNQKQDTPLEKGIDTQQFISTESLEEINTTNKNSSEVIRDINHLIKKVDLRLGDTRGIYFTKDIVDQKILLNKDNLFTFWETGAPDQLVRSLNKNFMLGAHAFKGNEGFLILKTNFYENSFAGMLEWETHLTRDVFNLFGTETYKKDRNIIDQKFQDVIVKNRDARVIKDNLGNIILIYSFPNRETIIISESSQTLNDIITKLNTQKGI